MKKSKQSKVQPVKKTVSKSKTSVKDDVKFLRKKLERGDISRIAKVTGYDNSHVARVIRGEAGNPSGEIMKYAKKMVTTRK